MQNRPARRTFPAARSGRSAFPIPPALRAF